MQDQIENAKKIFTIKQIAQILNGVIVCGEEYADDTVYTACGSDLMSDVLAFTKPGSVLLTGLTNSQVVRTAEMLDLKAIVFVRNKRPDKQAIQIANTMKIALIMTPYHLYESCGKLYAVGLSGCRRV